MLRVADNRANDNPEEQSEGGFKFEVQRCLLSY